MTGFKLTELLNGVFVWLLIDEPVVDAAEQDAVVIPIEVHTWDRGVAAWTVSGSVSGQLRHRSLRCCGAEEGRELGWLGHVGAVPGVALPQSRIDTLGRLRRDHSGRSVRSRAHTM
ncbi:MAG TPA: hypothetical protein VLZ05_00750 [Mycobacterium sp.]|nr:hypothetical protein [Mycobacterium sp.]HUH67534.1 hypothetical protein [Mycobacterium sp.]